MIGRLYNEQKKGHGGDRKSSGDLKIAKEYKIGERTVERAGEYAEAIDKIAGNLGEEKTDKILNGCI